MQSSASYYAIHTYKTKSEATLILITTRASVQFHFVFIRRSYLCSTLIACHKANRSIHSFIHSFIHSHTYPRTVDQNTHSDLFQPLPKVRSGTNPHQPSDCHYPTYPSSIRIANCINSKHEPHIVKFSSSAGHADARRLRFFQKVISRNCPRSVFFSVHLNK